MSETATAEPFNPAEWRTKGAVETDNPRAGMIPDIERRLHPGMSRAEVHDLLGPPDSEQPGLDSWNLGRATFAPSYEYFVVRFGADSRVSNFGLTRS